MKTFWVVLVLTTIGAVLSTIKWHLVHHSQHRRNADRELGAVSRHTAPGDYDGDSKADVAVYRDGVWYIINSAGGISITNFGLAGDLPLPASHLP